MKTPISPWAYAPSTQRREPTSTEIANGFPADRPISSFSTS